MSLSRDRLDIGLITIHDVAIRR